MNGTDEEIKEVVFDASTRYREHGAMGQSMVENNNKAPIAAIATRESGRRPKSMLV